jgi:hypothetical protein
VTRDNEVLLPGPFEIILHDGSLTVMDGEGRHESNGDEPRAQRQWTAMNGAMTTQR